VAVSEGRTNAARDFSATDADAQPSPTKGFGALGKSQNCGFGCRRIREGLMATTAIALVCPQGHGPTTPGTRFCTWCGSQLIAAPGQTPIAPGQPVPLAPSYPSEQIQAVQTAPLQPPPATFVPPAPVPATVCSA